MRRALKGAAALVVLTGLVLGGPKLYSGWRDYKVWAFCNDVRVGMSVSDLLLLEKRYGIDDTYSPRDPSPPQQNVHDLGFTSGRNSRDDGYCWVQHNGTAVTAAGLMVQ